MIKYYVRTFHRLPPSKWIMEDLSKVPSILDEMIDKRPTLKKDKGLDLFNSVSITKFDTEKLPNWQEVFKEFTDWDWIDVGSLYK